MPHKHGAVAAASRYSGRSLFWSISILQVNCSQQ